jgi:hypothetical protein
MLFIANERASAQGESQAKLIMPYASIVDSIGAFLEFRELLVLSEDHPK